ncbi:MAG: hypothetical protein E6230_20935 [Paenibacillus dendritiformis]|uniref:hypothetical protein n=1 Tax=Paenibacillus sp. FSL R5-0810 TaxID=2921659 RepID=UPI0025F574F8|nr:hypothetical protein [uncultured Paenibacillus sp.]MDU5144640.1 hypothetical protein [Paenibacillus dendritiformis]
MNDLARYKLIAGAAVPPAAKLLYGYCWIGRATQVGLPVQYKNGNRCRFFSFDGMSKLAPFAE